MPQSSVIFFFLAAAFLIGVVQRGELRTYLGFLYGKTSPGATPPAGGVAGALSSLGNVNTAGSAATNFSNWLNGVLGTPTSIPLN